VNEDVPAGASEDRALARIMLSATALVSGLGALLASVQAVLILGVFSADMRAAAADPFSEILLRWAFNFTAVAVVVGGVALLRPERRGTRTRLAMVLSLAVGASVVRTLLQMLSGTVDPGGASAARIMGLEMAMTFLLALLALGSGLQLADFWRRAREADRTRIEAQERALSLIDDVRAEEHRVRKDVAATIHGSVQGTFVVLEAELREIAVGNASSERIGAVADTLARLREQELRVLSERLYPVELDRGLAPAVRALAARTPAHVEVVDDASAPLAGLGARIDKRMRIVVVRVLEEGQTNALRHGGARRIRFAADVTGDALLLEVASDGASPAADVRMSGLARLRQQLGVVGGTLELAAGATEGAVLRARLPLP
jgi:signal transduction histidine kinase